MTVEAWWTNFPHDNGRLLVPFAKQSVTNLDGPMTINRNTAPAMPISPTNGRLTSSISTGMEYDSPTANGDPMNLRPITQGSDSVVELDIALARKLELEPTAVLDMGIAESSLRVIYKVEFARSTLPFKVLDDALGNALDNAGKKEALCEKWFELPNQTIYVEWRKAWMRREHVPVDLIAAFWNQQFRESDKPGSELANAR